MATGVGRTSPNNRAERWVRQHPVTTVLMASFLIGVVMVLAAAGIVSSRSAAFEANRRAAQVAAQADSLAQALCRDVNQRVSQRRESDRASSQAWAGIAQQLRVALAEVPKRQRQSRDVRRTWLIWADAHHAAIQLRDRGIQHTVTKC